MDFHPLRASALDSEPPEVKMIWFELAPIAVAARNRAVSTNCLASRPLVELELAFSQWVESINLASLMKNGLTSVVAALSNSIMILRPSYSDDFSEKTMPTLQAAFLRGIEQVFQVESSEIAVEALPDSAHKNALLFYEASEGGAGVLSRISNDENALKKVCEKALEMMHYSFPKDTSLLTPDNLVDTNENCLAGCYHCLLSYYNQPDHLNIDRHDPEALKLLTAILSGSIKIKENTISNDSVTKFARFLEENRINVPDLETNKVTRSGITIPYYSRQYKTAIFMADINPEDREHFENKGLNVLVIGNKEEEWMNNIDMIKDVFGGEI